MARNTSKTSPADVRVAPLSEATFCESQLSDEDFAAYRRWADDTDGAPVRLATEAIAQAIDEADIDALNMPFCACGRVISQCDGSRRGCGKGGL